MDARGQGDSWSTPGYKRKDVGSREKKRGREDLCVDSLYLYSYYYQLAQKKRGERSELLRKRLWRLGHSSANSSPRVNLSTLCKK